MGKTSNVEAQRAPQKGYTEKPFISVGRVDKQYDGYTALAVAIARAYGKDLKYYAKKYNAGDKYDLWPLVYEMRGLANHPVLGLMHADLEDVCLEYVNGFLTKKPKISKYIFRTVGNRVWP